MGTRGAWGAQGLREEQGGAGPQGHLGCVGHRGIPSTLSPARPRQPPGPRKATPGAGLVPSPLEMMSRNSRPQGEDGRSGEREAPRREAPAASAASGPAVLPREPGTAAAPRGPSRPDAHRGPERELAQNCSLAVTATRGTAPTRTPARPWAGRKQRRPGMELGGRGAPESFLEGGTERGKERRALRTRGATQRRGGEEKEEEAGAGGLSGRWSRGGGGRQGAPPGS